MPDKLCEPHVLLVSVEVVSACVVVVERVVEVVSVVVEVVVNVVARVLALTCL